LNIFQSYIASLVASAVVMYSASAIDYAIVACFFDGQENIPDPSEKYIGITKQLGFL